MSEKASTIETGLNLLGGFLKETEGFTTKVMAMNPANSLLMINLLGNLGYALTAPEGAFMFEPDPITGMKAYETRQELVSIIFKNTAEKAGEYMGSDNFAKMAGSIGLSSLIGGLT